MTLFCTDILQSRIFRFISQSGEVTQGHKPASEIHEHLGFKHIDLSLLVQGTQAVWIKSIEMLLFLLTQELQTLTESFSDESRKLDYRNTVHMNYSSSSQSFLWKTIFPWTKGRGMVWGMIQVHCTYCALSFCYWIGSTSDHQALEFGGWGHWITGICLFIQNTYILYGRDWWQSKLDGCPVFSSGAPLQWTQSPHSQTFGKHCAGILNLWLGRTPPTTAPKNTHH